MTHNGIEYASVRGAAQTAVSLSKRSATGLRAKAYSGSAPRPPAMDARG